MVRGAREGAKEAALRRSLILILLASACAMSLHASETRILNGTVAADDLKRIALDAGVGDVDVIPSDDGSVHYKVTLRPRRGGIFSSMKRAERDVREAELEADVAGAELRLRIDSSSEDRRFEENWEVAMPAHLVFELDLGVGDVEIRGLSGGIEVDAGVGDLVIDTLAGPVSVDTGVGDVMVKGRAAEYGRVECSTGVGDASIRVRGASVSSDGFVGHSADWSGDGRHEIQIDLGVGDAKVRLD